MNEKKKKKYKSPLPNYLAIPLSEYPEEAVEIVKKYCNQSLSGWNGGIAEKRKALKRVVMELCQVYSVPKVRFRILGYRIPEYGGYNSWKNEIVIGKTSLITALHEFAHHVECHRLGRTSERSAREFSLSLVFVSSPQWFGRAIKKHKVLFV